MTTLPDWLPPMACVNPWTNETFDMLDTIFKRDFKDTQPIYEKRPVRFFPEKDEGKEVLFWHLTHREDKGTGERLPDFRRSERLPWIRSIIEHSTKPEVWAWDYKEGGGKINTYLWLKHYDFLVLLRKSRKGNRYLLTSFCIDYLHKRRELEKKYNKRIR